MSTQFPCSDYVETHGVFFFARMLDKVRLHAKGLLPPGYNVGFNDPTSFDARFCRFWEIDFEEARAKALETDNNDTVFDFCFRHRSKPNAEQIQVWNDFLTKRGWRDGNTGVEDEKTLLGLSKRDDIQTWLDLHDIEEGRTPRFAK